MTKNLSVTLVALAVFAGAPVLSGCGPAIGAPASSAKAAASGEKAQSEDTTSGSKEAGPYVFSPPPERAATYTPCTKQPPDNLPVAANSVCQPTKTEVYVNPDDQVETVLQVFQPIGLPEGTKTPVIIDDSPYYESRAYPATNESADFAQDLVDYFVPRGYTVVKMEMRGTGRSGGCFDNWGPASAQDLAGVIEYYADKKLNRWSNGKVGLWGGSAEGTAAQMAAVLHPKGLTAVVAMNAVSGEYDEHAFDGVTFDGSSGNGNLQYAYNYFLTDHPTTAEGQEAHNEAVRYCQWEAMARTTTPVVNGNETPWYLKREYRLHVGDIQTPFLYYAGLLDVAVPPIAMDGWYDEIPSFKRAIVAYAPHLPPWQPDAWTNAAPQALPRADWWKIFGAWFDHWLLDADTGVEQWPAVQVEDEHHIWRAVGSIGEMGAERTYALGNGTLMPIGVSPPAPTATGNTLSFAEAQTATWSIPVNPADAADKPPLHLSGQAYLNAVITLDRPDANFDFEIRELKADGTNRILVHGYLSASHRSDGPTWADHLVANQSQNLVPLYSPQTYYIRTEPFDAWIAGDSTIQVTLSGVDQDASKETDSGFFRMASAPLGTGFVATVDLDHSTVELPISNDTCGVVVDNGVPASETPPCQHLPR